jgi:hypothetical protein
MKKAVFVLVPMLAILGWFGWKGMVSTKEAAPAAASSPAITVQEAVAPTAITWQGAPPTQSVMDASAVFKRAFWRRPSAQDEILHAVRHEWSDADGLARWQWFIVVKASPRLIKDLRDNNSFGLVPAASGPAAAESPDWFEFNPVQVSEIQSPDARLRLMFSKADNTLYATASGGGFTKGAPEPLPPAIQSAPSIGRLPSYSPPTPKPEE